jgi:hypothetical protein
MMFSSCIKSGVKKILPLAPVKGTIFFTPDFIQVLKMLIIPAETFIYEGTQLLNVHGHRRRQGHKTILRRFKSVFCATPTRCQIAWKLLAKNGLLPTGAMPKHLLWSLMMLKTYATESVLCGIAGTDEKTFRKWAWGIASGLENLGYKLVSEFFLSALMHFCYYTNDNAFLSDSMVKPAPG